ncbi:PREDICTED: acyl-CoA desaturase 1-like [Dipodomys ordii]|uniref:stearoyl-CoA 9-desaturase n=1 Tax=Dipodomys ordii TaxID=10020 RepID=A0A1S3FAV9_DIPOR|nr:PREDICTED: acyl-CoA desaturase 1-like [Dipodomys ordii]
MPVPLLQEKISDSSTTTIMKPLSMDLQNKREKLKDLALHLVDDIRPEMKEDIYDPTYQDEVGPAPKLEYVWRNIILMALLHLGALYGITLAPGCKAYTWLWAFLCYVVSILGITAGAHRLWSHRTYKARLPLRLFLIIANSMAFQNDVYEWARDHRVHHKFTETHADPHNSRRGFFFCHVGWLLVRKQQAVKEKGGLLDLSDLKAEKLLMFQRRYYSPSVLLMCFILPTLVPWYCWGETFRHSLYVTFLRYAVVLNVTWLVNSVAHLYGYRPYDKNIEGRENVLISLGTLGEGFHNYHHIFPYDYSASEYHWSFNFTTFFIDCMAAIGLAYDLKKVPKASILARIKRTGDGSYKSGCGAFPNSSIVRVWICAGETPMQKEETCLPSQYLQITMWWNEEAHCQALRNQHVHTLSSYKSGLIDLGGQELGEERINRSEGMNAVVPLNCHMKKAMEKQSIPKEQLWAKMAFQIQNL